MAETFEFSRQGRTLRTAAILIAIYATLLVAIIVIDAVWWLMAALALLTGPALWDLWRDPRAGLRLDDTTLQWRTGRHSATLELSEIDFMRIDTRWDFSVRVTAVLKNARRIRLPYESLPPHRALETALAARGIAVERHHFMVF